MLCGFHGDLGTSCLLFYGSLKYELMTHAFVLLYIPLVDKSIHYLDIFE